MHASFTHSLAKLMSLMRDLGVRTGRITTDGSSLINVIFFGYYAMAIAAKSVPNMARKVSLPETSIRIRRRLSPICIRLAGVMKSRGYRRQVRKECSQVFNS